MYIKLRTINSVLPEKWVTDGEYIFYARKFDLIKANISSGKEQVLRLFDIISIVRLYNKYVIVFFSSKGVRINRDTFEVIKDEDFEKRRLYHLTPVRDKLFGRVYLDKDFDKSKEYLYDIKTQVQLWDTEAIINPVLIEEYCFSKNADNDKVERIDIDTGSIIWTQSVSKVGQFYKGKLNLDRITTSGQVNRFLGVNDELVWVLLYNGLVIALNIETGDIEHKIGMPENATSDIFSEINYDRDRNYYYNHDAIFDPIRFKIFYLGHFGLNETAKNYYFEIDLNSKEPRLIFCEIDNLTEEAFIVQSFPHIPFDEKYIYLFNRHDSKIALFDRFNRNIVLVQKLGKSNAENLEISRMQVLGKRLFISEFPDILYVYEYDEL
ncbi:MAG: hypothetical protein KF862_10170 [Chitinophagaceae bacterium]|nr:hypothetical protein [Chitinophagaceae bacterium]